MSRRKPRPRDPAPEAAPREPRRARARDPEREAAPRERGLAADLAIVAAVFAVTVVIAELAGAANLGVSLGIGQIVFAIVLAVRLVRG